MTAGYLSDGPGQPEGPGEGGVERRGGVAGPRAPAWDLHQCQPQQLLASGPWERKHVIKDGGAVSGLGQIGGVAAGVAPHDGLTVCRLLTRCAA